MLGASSITTLKLPIESSNALTIFPTSEYTFPSIASSNAENNLSIFSNCNSKGVSIKL